MTTEPRTSNFAGLPVRKASDAGPGGAIDWGLCMAIYAKGGAGKTTLAATLADSSYGSPLCVADIEGGTSVLTHREDIDVIDTITSWSSIQKFCRECATENLPWKSIVLDNFCEIAELEMATRVSPGATPELRDYNLNTRNMSAFARFWRNLSRSKGVNVVINFWEETDKSESTGLWETRFALTPKLANILPGILDIVGYLTVEDRTETRILNLAPNRRYVTKFRRAPTSAAMKIPSVIYNPHLGEILDVLKGGKAWDEKKHVRPTGGQAADSNKDKE